MNYRNIFDDRLEDLFEEEVVDDLFNDDDTFFLTEWGCLYSVLNDYGIDVSHIKGKVGQHIVEDFMDLMEKAGYVEKYIED